MTKEMERELLRLLYMITDNIEANACDGTLTENQITCLLAVVDAINQAIKDYF